MANLPPLPPSNDEFWDGEKYSAEITHVRCTHKDAKIINGELRCQCGSAWSGPNIQVLQKLLTTDK